MTITRKAAGPADFLSLVPAMVGYTPARSVVAIPFAGPRTIGLMRFDLPPMDELEPIAATITGMAMRVPDMDGIAVVVYTDDAGLEGVSLPILYALQAQLERCGVRIVDLLFVAADGWGGITHELSPLAELMPEDPEIQGLVRGEDQSAGTELIDLGKTDDVSAALVTLKETIDALRGTPDEVSSDALECVNWLDDLPVFFETLMDYADAQLSEWAIATLAWCTERPALRDIALVQWTRDRAAGVEALAAQLAWEGGVEYPAHLAMQMWGEGLQPDPARLERALVLVKIVAGNTPTEYRAGALAVAAWLSWALGRSTHAEIFANQARECDPEHGLAEIVLSFVRAGHLPDWAFRRPAGA